MGVVASINNGPLSAMMDHSSIWCPPVHRQAKSALFGFTAELVVRGKGGTPTFCPDSSPPCTVCFSNLSLMNRTWARQGRGAQSCPVCVSWCLVLERLSKQGERALPSFVFGGRGPYVDAAPSLVWEVRRREYGLLSTYAHFFSYYFP